MLNFWRGVYFILSKVYIDEGGMKSYSMVCPPIREIIHLLKLVDYLLVKADKRWFNYYLYMHIEEVLLSP